ncbi:MAG TPA: hypothetical protein VIF65_00100 [Methyloceanibacter sp.]
MSRQAHIDRVWHVIDKAGICMMTTQFDGGMRATDGGPPDKDAGVIWFLTDHRGLKDDEIDAHAGGVPHLLIREGKGLPVPHR